MDTIPQFTFDFEKAEAERPLMEQWARQEAAQAWQWTPEAMTCVWVLGRLDLDWWATFPRYSRIHWMEVYADCQRTLQKGQCMPAFDEILPVIPREVIALEKDQVSRMADEIRQAFLNRQPCPFIMEPRFQYLLEAALREASIPLECLPTS